MRRFLALACLLSVLGCGPSEAPAVTATVTLSFGKDGPPIVEPPPSRVTINARTTTGATREVGRFGWPPPSTFTLTAEAGEGLLLEAVATTDAGTIPLRGETPFVRAEELEIGGVVLVMAKTTSMVRTDHPLVAAAPSPKAALALGRFVVLAQDAKSFAFDTGTYRSRDFLSLQATPNPLAGWGQSYLVSLDPSGASVLDVTTGDRATLDVDTTPLLGARAVTGADGTYIVGPTRDTDSAVVLALRQDAVSVNVPVRNQASAAWVLGVGLVIAGGTDSTLLLLAAGKTEVTVRSLGLPPSVGAIVAPLGNNACALLGGGAKTQLITPTCDADCVKTTDSLVDIQRGEAFGVGNSAFVFGENKAGENVAYLVKQDGSATPLPLKVPRKGATAVPVGDGYVVVIGGTALADGAGVLDVEMFTPP